MNREQACNYLRSSGFSEEQIKAIEGAFTCEDAISRQAAIDALDKRFDSIPMEQTTEILLLRKDLREVLPSINPQKPKSECEHDHEILKAYSDGANEVLEKIRAEMANHLQIMDICDVEKVNGVIVQSELSNRKVVLYDTVLHIVDKYKSESEEV